MAIVYFGSARQARLEANETLPAKLDLIIDILAIRDRVKGETVAIKMHTRNNLGCSTVHPVFVRSVVQAVKDGGGKPFRWIHGPHKDPYLVCEYGEKLGLGSRRYELMDVLPVEQLARAGVTYISAR